MKAMSKARLSTLTIAAVPLLAWMLSCGGNTPSPKSAGDDPQPKGDSTDTTASAEPTSSSSDEPSPKDDTKAAQSCPHDTSTPLKSQIGTLTITGCINPKQVETNLTASYKSIHDCFSQELKSNKKAKGAVSIRINVGQKGVYGVRVTKSDINSDEFIKCVVQVVESVSMPKPETGSANIELVSTF